MNVYKIKIFDENNRYFHSEEIYCESLKKCRQLYLKKYPKYTFDIEEGVI